jgi:hypothetical protein
MVQATKNCDHSGAEIAKASPVALTYVRRWIIQDMVTTAQLEHQKYHQGEFLLQQQERTDVISLATKRREEHALVTQEWTREAIDRVTNHWVPNSTKSYTSRF